MKFAFVSAGYVGHLNDAQCYRLIPEIGPGRDLEFPEDAYLLGDSAYPCEYPLISPYRRQQITAAEGERREQMVNINYAIKRRRIYVEHLIGHLKMYRVIGSLYHHRRRDMSRITQLCVGLAERRLHLFD